MSDICVLRHHMKDCFQAKTHRTIATAGEAVRPAALMRAFRMRCVLSKTINFP